MDVRRRITKLEKRGVAALPDFCDFKCVYAAFAPADAVGACRRDQAVYCSLLKKFNAKNGRCLAKAGDA